VVFGAVFFALLVAVHCGIYSVLGFAPTTPTSVGVVFVVALQYWLLMLVFMALSSIVVYGFQRKKKKTGLWITLVVIVLIIAAGAVWAKGYYEDHYVGSDYYTMVPMDEDLTPQPLYDRNGKVMETGKIFVLTGYNDQGVAKELEFTVRGDSPSDFPGRGTYLKVISSKYLVNGWSVVDKAEVPAAALAQINAH